MFNHTCGFNLRAFRFQKINFFLTLLAYVEIDLEIYFRVKYHDQKVILVATPKKFLLKIYSKLKKFH